MRVLENQAINLNRRVAASNAALALTNARVAYYVAHRQGDYSPHWQANVNQASFDLMEAEQALVRESLDSL